MIKRIFNFYKRQFWNPIKYARYIGVKVGKSCSFGKVSFGTEPYLIEIGDHVQLTSDISFFTHGAAWVFRERHPEFDFFGKIKVKNNVYIGNNVLILPGVTIESNCIIAAGSVVTKSVPEGKIVGGNPAKIIGEVEAFYDRIKMFNVGSKDFSVNHKREYLTKLDENIFIKK